ncbi:hypothetical protein [Lysinibacillus sp. 54212]|uniref:hypothetical protein n=1 Tax=Lysinibacillus sp. 54212 TaxID=3119829 RepID=UPI002FC93D6D
MDISLMEAYSIEALKEQGITLDRATKKLESGQLEDWNEKFQLDFSLLQELYKANPSLFKEAYQSKYKIKFVTINGLKNLLRLKFNIEETQYTIVENGILHLQTDEEIEDRIRYMLSSNWTVLRDESGLSIIVKGE